MPLPALEWPDGSLFQVGTTGTETEGSNRSSSEEESINLKDVFLCSTRGPTSSALGSNTDEDVSKAAMLDVVAAQVETSSTIALESEAPGCVAKLNQERATSNTPFESGTHTTSQEESIPVLMAGLWYRGLAVRKNDGKFSIYLLDLEDLW